MVKVSGYEVQRMGKPLTVTAVITNYNQGKFFRSAFQSLLAQTRVPDQIIVVDDKSTDDSVKIIVKELGQLKTEAAPDSIFPTVDFIPRETNGKPAGARNSGITKATGDLIAFLDVDDFYYVDKIASAVEIFNKYEQVGLVYSDYNVLDLRNATQYREFKHPYEYQYLWQSCIVSTDSVYRRSVFDKVGLFNEQLFGVEDYEMYLRIAKHYMIYHVAEPQFCYRLHGGNLTLNHSESMAQQINKFKQEMMNAQQTTR